MADTTIVWDNQIFTGPYPAGIIASSNAIINSNNYKNSVKATIEYKTIVPDGKDVLVGFLLQAVLEEEISSGVWVPIATQFDQIKGTDEAQKQVVDIRPGYVENFGSADKVFSGVKEVTAISTHDGVAPEKIRLCLLNHIIDDTRPQLSSVTVSGWVTLYNR